MATDKQKLDAIVSERFRYKVREPYYHGAMHHADSFKNLGYDYRGNILRKTTSPEIWANPLQIPMYGYIEGMVTYLIETVKIIKKTFSIAHDKDDTKIN
jgi:hypothetical protein